MKPTKRYDVKIDLSADTVYTRILHLVGEGKRVLDVGCATGWREQAEVARAKLERLRLTVKSMVARAQAKEADWELWLKRHRELEERLGSIERTTAYRPYRALTALVCRFWSIEP